MKIDTKYWATAAVLAATASLSTAGTARADQIIADDLIVMGSLCVGLDCVNNESFGFASLRLKENNTRIDFVDTSVGAGFPTNDWRIQANDSASGGSEALTFRSMGDGSGGGEGGTPLLTLTNGAPANSIFVDSTGRVGLKTATPVLDLHMNTSNTPAIRLEQNNSGGFTAQTWDVAGNEANFFVRDLTGGSRLPFRIRPGAPTSSIDVAANGNVGLGSSSPADALHIARTSGPVGIRLQSGSQPNPIRLNFNTNTNEFRITYDGLPINQFRLTSAGNIIIPGTITTSGTCSVGCDRVFEPGFEIPSIQEQTRLMYANRYLPGVGPTKEGEAMNLTEKVEGILHELEKAHIYISQLEEMHIEMQSRLDRIDTPRAERQLDEK
jgi:hypothetical protein